MGARKVDLAISSELEEELRRLGEAEFQALRDKQNAGLVLATGKEILFTQYLGKNLERMFAKGVPAKLQGKKPPKAKTTERVLNLVMSDTHYGSNLDPREVGHSYGPVEEARRTAEVVSQTVNYKSEHRDHTTLIWHLLGDLIQGHLHDPRDGAPLAEQMADCIHILSQALRHLAENFPKVVVCCTPGNHGRRKDRHPDRAVFQKWDSNENVVYFALKQIAKMSGWENVEVVMPRTPFYRISALGNSIFGTHGDTVINPGNPHRSINVTNISNQVNKLVATELLNEDPQTTVVLLGHVHISSQTELTNGVTVFTNGPLIPSDSYSNSIGGLYQATSQWLFETTKAYAVGDSRRIKVDYRTDKNSALDAVITPFQGY